MIHESQFPPYFVHPLQLSWSVLIAGAPRWSTSFFRRRCCELLVQAPPPSEPSMHNGATEEKLLHVNMCVFAALLPVWKPRVRCSDVRLVVEY